MKFCPKCGKKLTANDKFCDRCGADVSQIPAAHSQTQNNPVQSSAPLKNTVNKSTKNKRIRHNCLLAATYIILIAAGGMVFFTLQSQNHAMSLPFIGNKNAKFDETAKKLGFKDNNLSPDDMAGLTISFAHMHFMDDPDWNQAFDAAENGDLHIQSVPEYRFGDYDVQAPNGGAVYVVSPNVGYVVSDVAHPAQSKVTFVSRKGAGKEVFFPALAKKVSDNNTAKNKVQTIVKQVNVSKKHAESSEDSSQSSSSNDKNTNSSTDEAKDLTWNDDKEEELADFMDSFGKKMKQKYEEYDGENSIENIAGEKYPDDLEDRTFKLYSEGDDEEDDSTEIDIGWDPELKKDYDYHVISIFNCNVGNPEQHITYLFAIHDDQPVALVDQTTNGDACMVKETSNKDVRNAFANIMAGKDADSDD